MRTLVIAVTGAALCMVLIQAARHSPLRDRARGLGARSRWRLPAAVRVRLERALGDAAVPLEPEPACELAVAVAGSAGILAFAVAPPMAPVAALAVLGAGPVALRLARDRAERRFVAALPAALEQVAAVLRSGGTVGDGVRAIAASDSPVAPDLRRVQARSELGVGLGDALGRWADERDTGGVRAAAGALAVATTMGGRAADAIDGLACSLRDRLGAAAEAGALSAQSRLSAAVVGVAPIAYLAFSTITDPKSTGTLVTTTPGRICLGLGLVLELAGVWWMRRIVRVAP